MTEPSDSGESALEGIISAFVDFSEALDLPTWLIRKTIPIFTHSITETSRTAKARWELDSKMDRINRSYNKVRGELYEVGLLADGEYLDSIELEVALLPNLGEVGYVFERVPFHLRLLGWREGVIYLPGDVPALHAHMPGGCLIDTIRHEYAHAWHWMEPDFFERPWYEKAFSIAYDDVENIPLRAWFERKERNREFRKSIKACRTETQAANHLTRELRNDFVSEYAATLSREDFAETFMLYLKHRNNLNKFSSRKGVCRKLLAVEQAVKTARRELGL
jgi:hypothetical protein